MLLALTIALALGSTPVDTIPQVAAPRLKASAYLDPTARQLVRRARERRDVSDRSITAYRALARERISVGLRALRRDRMAFRRELAANVYWTRNGVGKVEVLGARRVIPVVFTTPAVPDDLHHDAPDLAFDPGKDHILQGMGKDDFFRHPLAPGSEADYRFQTGDTTRVRLSPERVLSLVELRVIPRRSDARLLQGSFWLDLDTHAPVRATFRMVRPVDMERDLGEDDEDIPGVLKPIRGELRFITVDYGLWEQRWWLPRLISLEFTAQAGGMVNVPVTYERSYTDYQVTTRDDSASVAAIFASDSLRAGRESSRPSRSCHHGDCWRYTIELPEDTLGLLSSEFLPESIYTQGESLISEAELRELADVLEISLHGFNQWRRPEVEWSYLRADLLRFNRVEGLAIGGRADVDVGALGADATLWLGTAGPELSGEVGVFRAGFRHRHRLAAYRRLDTVEPDPRALGLGSSLSALVLGRDDSDYFRTLGAELTGESAARRTLSYRWRLFAERQEAAEKNTDFSLPHLFDRSREFAPVLRANAADQVGGEVVLRAARGLDPAGFRWGGEAALGLEAGSYRLARPALSAYATFPLPAKLVGALEAAGGTSLGEVPLQRRWFIGGPATVRGFGGGSRVHGEAYWRGRAEVASALPGARLVLFSDAGWAGERAELSIDPVLVSAGAGVSLIDGLLRVDLARALRGGRGWRLDFHVDAPI